MVNNEVYSQKSAFDLEIMSITEAILIKNNAGTNVDSKNSVGKINEPNSMAN